MMTRRRMGQIVSALGPGAHVRLTAEDPGKQAARKDHVEAAKRLSTGGKNIGEQKGYGATAAVTTGIVPLPPAPPPPIADPEGTCAHCRASLDDMNEDVIAAEIDGEPRVWCGEACLAAWTVML